MKQNAHNNLPELVFREENIISFLNLITKMEWISEIIREDLKLDEVLTKKLSTKIFKIIIIAK